MPTSGDLPQPTQVEAAPTPRQRVEASFRERQQTANKLNHLSNEWVDRGNRGGLTPEIQERKELPLKRRLLEQNRVFREEIVNNLPEAEVWVEIERKNLEDTIRRHGGSTRPTTPTDDAYSKIAVQMGNRNYAEAIGNLKKVRERDASVSTTSK